MEAAIPLMAIGTGISAFSMYQQGQMAQQAQAANARMLEGEAAAAKQQANYEADLARERLKKLIGTQRTLYAKAGVDLGSGSPLLVLADTQAQGEKDIEMIRWGGDVNATKLRNQATLARFYGRQSATSGLFGAAGTLASGIGKVGYMSKVGYGSYGTKAVE